jgi:glyoxylase I family protein
VRGVERPQQVGVAHLGLSVTDLARSTAFYCDVLGAQVMFEAHDAGSFRRVVVRLGSHAIDINEFPSNNNIGFDAAHTGLDHLAFAAPSRESLDEWARWLDANDVARSAIRDIPAEQYAGALFDFVDPDGIQLEFIFVDSERYRGDS